MKRLLVIIVSLLLVLAIIAVVAVQIILMSDLPREWIVQAIADQTGLDVQAESVSVRWSGRTTVRQTAVSGPLSDREFLSAETIELRHHSLPMLLLTQSLGLRSVRVAQPHLSLWRDEQGRWNVQNVADHLAAVAGSSEPQVAMDLPNIDIEAGSIGIAGPNGRDRTVGPFAFRGATEKGLLWRFALDLPEGIALHGELTKGGNWAHWAEFVLEPAATLQQAILAKSVQGIRAVGRWDGRVEGDGLRGALRFDALGAGAVFLTGSLGVATQAGVLTVSPESLVLAEPNLLGQQVRLAAGKVRIGPGGLAADALHLHTDTIAAQLDGRWNLDTQAGELTANWAGRIPGREGELRGTIHAAVRSPRHGLKQAQLTTTARAQTEVGTWRIDVQTDAVGSEWGKSLWETRLREFTWTRQGQEIDLTGATAAVSVDSPQVRLIGLSLPYAGQVQAQAQLDWQTWQWSMLFDTTGFRLSEPGQGGLDIRLRGEGDNRQAAFSELRLGQGQRTMTGKGSIAFQSRQVHDAHISAQWPGTEPPPSASGRTPEPGQWTCELDITGTVHPLVLDTDGTLAGRNVRLGQRDVAQLEIPVHTRVDTERVEIATSPFVLLEGRWQLSGSHRLVDPETQLKLSIQDLSLQNAAEMAGSPLACQGQASAQLQLTVPDFDIEKALAFGSWEVADLNVPPFEAEKAQGQIRIAEGLVRFDEIQLTEGQGQAEGAMRFRLDQPQRLSVRFASTDWPVKWDAQPVVLITDSNVDVQVDLANPGAPGLDGTASLASRLMVQERQFGQVNMSIQVRQRTLEVEEFDGELLGGSVEGSAQVPLNRLAASVGQLHWQGIEPARLAPWYPQVARASGTFSGSLTATQTDDQERPLEPLRIDVQARLDDGSFGAAQVQDVNIVAYVGSRRLLVDESSFRLLGGQITAWARVSPHAGQLYLAITADINDVDVNQIAQVADPNTEPLVGRLSGTGTLMTSSDWRRLSGQADLRLTQSDLGNNPVIRTLYNTLSLDLGQVRPEGTGRVDILFAGARVQIPSFAYFNRGVEVRGAGTIQDFSLGSDSPVDGYAVGSTRVLKGVQLPGVRQLDRLMSSLQTGMASVTIEGTVSQAKVNIVPLPVVGEALRGLLWTQLREEQ